MKKPLVPLILASELLLILFLSGCVLENFDISTLRYFKPFGFRSGSYKIILNAQEFAGMNFKILKSVEALYIVNKGEEVKLESAQFENSFEMHEFWHKWTRKHFSLGAALESEWWWFSGKIEANGIIAWYKGKVVFILSSKDEKLLKKVKKELDVFTETFSGAPS
ncbi:hypothetical protein [Mesoaciditoga lauensis]|uniref:hypothetical protein n=1 Tax=Mesoaciditoga lauensis TaxID=1495039 RepID=UPI0005637570|nr:hypothetical protein [Mesoaciditoga lauensis]